MGEEREEKSHSRCSREWGTQIYVGHPHNIRRGYSSGIVKQGPVTRVFSDGFGMFVDFTLTG